MGWGRQRGGAEPGGEGAERGNEAEGGAGRERRGLLPTRYVDTKVVLTVTTKMSFHTCEMARFSKTNTDINLPFMKNQG